MFLLLTCFGVFLVVASQTELENFRFPGILHTCVYVCVLFYQQMALQTNPQRLLSSSQNTLGR